MAWPTATEIRSAALVSAVAKGCTCDPDIETTELEPGVFSATVAHDDWCALMRRRDRN